MTAVQPDLFGDYDLEAAEKRQAEEQAEHHKQLWQSPHTCPSCGTAEPNGYLLRNNHGWHPEALPTDADRKCTAQWLTTNHITYYATHQDPDNLALAMDRGRQLGLDIDTIRDTAVDHCGDACPYRGCPTCQYQGGEHPRKEP